MKFTLTATIIMLLLGCKESNTKDSITRSYPYEITFKVKINDEKDLKYFDNGVIPWISIKDAESELKNLIDKDDIVISENSIVLIIDYPLNNPVEIKVNSETDKGFPREKLISLISAEYHRVYKEEAENSGINVIPVDEREGISNRNNTNGKYGIWGHDIDDLVLPAVVVRKSETGDIKVELIVES